MEETLEGQVLDTMRGTDEEDAAELTDTIRRAEDLRNWEPISKEDEVWRSKPKIQRLSHFMRGLVAFERFFSPKFIAIGPIHQISGFEALSMGEQHKEVWTSMYLKETNERPSQLLPLLCDDNELDNLFARDSMEEFKNWFNEKKEKENFFWGRSFYYEHIWKLFVDGCSLLQVLDKSELPNAEEALGLSIDQLIRVHEDLVLLENQIPFHVLKLLCNDQAKLKRCLDNFLQIHQIALPSRTEKLDVGKEKKQELQEHKIIVQENQNEEDEPVHLLDYLRRAILRNSGDDYQVHVKDKKSKRKSMHLRKYRIGSIRELKAVGIGVKKHDANNTSFRPYFDDVRGQLLLPELTVDGSTALLYLNLIAYEMCPDFRNDLGVSSFIVFMSSLIEQPEDVKELRVAGILRNELASDKEVADLFNKMDIILVPETEMYASVVSQIEAYIDSKRGRIKILGWMGEAYNTFFRSPWTIIALLAAAFGLALTFTQTWYAIHPKGS